MKERVAKIAAACFCHIRRMRQVRRRIGREVTQQLVLALIMSRLNYCNSVLAALPTSTLKHPECSCPTRLVFCLSRSNHNMPTLIQLHWLLVSYRIKFKLCCLVHAIHYGCSPAYLTETVQSVGASRLRCGLRSSSTSSMDYSLPQLHTKFDEQAFSHAGSATWNSLPDHIRTVADPVSFRILLKSHYFSQLLTFVDFCVFLGVLAFG